MVNPFKSLMEKLAKDSYKRGESWKCPFCPHEVSPQDKTFEEYLQSCLDHSKGHGLKA